VSWARLKPIGESVTDELLNQMSPDDTIRVVSLMRAALTREQCGDLSIVADKLYKGLRQEFNTGATFMVLDAARRKAMKVKHKGKD